MNILSLIFLLPLTQAEVLVETGDDLSMQIGQKLRCPVCQGMPISESPSPMAQDMMAAVRDMCAEGKSEEEITGFFVQRYGEWVLLEPEARGMNLSLWFLPVIVLCAGILVAVWLARRSSREPPKEYQRKSSGDPYVDAVREEVDR